MSGHTRKTKTELVTEVDELRRRVAQLEAARGAVHGGRELEARSRIAEAFLLDSEEAMYHSVLEILLDVFDSRFGVMGYIDEEGAYVVPSMTRHIWDQCSVEQKSFVFARDTWGRSTWPCAIREKRLIFMNKPSTRTPAGHIRISRHISAPVIFGSKVVGLFQVANKKTDYGPEDLALARNIGDAIAPILAARLERDRAERQRKSALKEIASLNKQLEARVAAQSEAIIELSTPVVVLRDKVLLMPLIGVIDTRRAQLIMEGLLDAVATQQARVCIVDVTGVPTVDTAVAQHLIKTVSAASMLGAKVLLTGVGTDTAQTLVKLGIDLAGLNSCGSLKVGITRAFGLADSTDS